MAVLYPPMLVTIPEYGNTGVQNGEVVRATDWMRLSRATQHYLLSRHAQPSAIGMAANCAADVTHTGACSCRIAFTAPLLWLDSYVWCVVDGYDFSAGSGTTTVQADLSLDGTPVGSSKTWIQGWQPVLIDWELELGSGALVASPTAHYLQIDLTADAEGPVLRTAGIIHRTVEEYTIP